MLHSDKSIKLHYSQPLNTKKEEEKTTQSICNENVFTLLHYTENSNVYIENLMVKEDGNAFLWS